MRFRQRLLNRNPRQLSSIEHAVIKGVARNIELRAGGIRRLQSRSRLAGQTRAVDAPVKVMQCVQSVRTFGSSSGFIGKTVKQHRWPVEVTQTHLREHLLRNPSVHRDGESLSGEVVERDLLPYRKPEPVGEQCEHLVWWMVVDADEAGMQPKCPR